MNRRERQYEAAASEVESVSVVPEASEWTPGEVRAMAKHEDVDPETWFVYKLTTYPDIEERLGKFAGTVARCEDDLFRELKAAYRLAHMFIDVS